MTRKTKTKKRAKVKVVRVAKKTVTAEPKPTVIKAKAKKKAQPKTNAEWLAYHETEYHAWNEKKLNHAGGGTKHQNAKVQFHAGEMKRYQNLLTPTKTTPKTKTLLPKTETKGKSTPKTSKTTPKTKTETKPKLSDWQLFCQKARKKKMGFAEIAKEWKKQRGAK